MQQGDEPTEDDQHRITDPVRDLEKPANRVVGDRDLTQWRTPAGRWFASSALRLARVITAHGVSLLVIAVGAAVAVPLIAASGEVYEAVLEHDDLAVLDQPVLDWAVAHRGPTSSQAVTFFTDLGGGTVMPVIVVAVTLLLVWLRRSWMPVVLVVLAVGGSLLFTIAGKDLVGRARPPRTLAVPPFEDSPSFPSGHTLNSTVIAGVVAYLVLPLLNSLASRILAVGLAIAWAVAMGASRVWLGHHWLTDVVVAWTLGIAWLAVVITAHRLYLTARFGSWRTPTG